jgi:serine/threonine-protein kinase
LRRELEDEEKDRQLLVRLERLWGQEVEIEYAHAFSDHGLDIYKLTVEEAVAWVRRRPLATRQRLIAGLDAWLLQTPARSKDRQWLFQVLQTSDDNAQRKELQAAVAANSLQDVERLATPEAVAEYGPETVLLLAGYLQTRSRDRAIALLRVAQARFPADFWITYHLAEALMQKNILDLAQTDRYEEPLRFFTAALALRPDSDTVLVRLGKALAARGHFDEAVAALKRVIAHQPNDESAYVTLGFVYEDRGWSAEAEKTVRHAIRLRPQSSEGHAALGLLLWNQGRYDEAAAALRRANRLSASASSHLGLAGILWRKGRQDEAAGELRKALAIQKDFTAAKFLLQLGELADRGRFKEAENLCRTITSFQPKNPYGHLAAYLLLVTQGRFADALPAIKRCVELAALTPDVRRFPVRILQETEAVLALEPKMPAFLKGKLKPQGAAERDLVLYWCWANKRFAGAAGLYAAAFTADPQWADDLLGEHRYDAARSAARAAAGLGDGAALDAKERQRWRTQALDWLRDDLAARARQLQDASVEERAEATARLRWWQQDPALASLRDPKALAQLPADERARCATFWKDVAAVLSGAKR